MKTLVLGCGLKKPAGSIGIDINPATMADVIHNLNTAPYPFKNDQFDVIICHDILEHLDNLIPPMQEIHRIGKCGAYIDIKTPHFSSILSWNDPTHKHHFSSKSFDYFTNDPARVRTQFYTQEKFEYVKKEVSFTKSPLSIVGKLIYTLSPRIYEHHFTWMLPAKGISILLRIIK